MAYIGAAVFARAAAGAMRPEVSHRVPLARPGDVMRAIAGRQSIGKVVLVPRTAGKAIDWPAANSRGRRAMEYKDCTFTITDGVGVFTLNKPDQRNALTEHMFNHDLPNLVRQVREDSSIGAVVMTGAGGVFCAGGNIKGMQNEKTPYERNEALHSYQRLVIDLANLPVPMIAAVDGAAYGAGFSLALAADFVMASTRARFCNAFGRVGLVPDLGMLYFLPRIVGVPRAKELIYTARSFTPEEARDLGIVLSVHSPDALLGEARRMAGRLTKASRVAVALSKGALNQSLSQDIETMMAIERAGQAQCRLSAFHKEAVGRFLEKKPPLYDWDVMEKKAAE